MRSLLLLSAAFVFATTAAQAETFTFTGKNTQVTQIAGPGPGGRPIVGGHSKSETEVTWASGTKEKAAGDCMAWSAPPASGFTVQGVCSATGPSGTSFLSFTCLATNDKNTESDCWGRLTYTAGKNKGKVATASWHGKQNADGKGGAVVGAGNMY